MNLKKLLFSFGLILMASGVLVAQDFDYIGAAKCKMCHNKSTTGAQYKVWSASPHANAMATLATEEAMAIAKEKGIADPAKDAACTKCHSTAASINPDLNAGVKETEGVSCESCHGPGSKYKSNAIMKDREKALAAGMIIPDENLCKTCHNEESPTFKGFNFEEYSKKIAHPIPAAE